MKPQVLSLIGLVLALGMLSMPLAAEPAPGIETTGALERSVFDAWLDRGPQYLLSQVVPMPVTREKRFIGFRVSRWFPAHPEVTEGAVKLGDVVQRVNGRSVERPDQFLSTWKQLRGARALVLDGLRDGRPWRATLTIVDPPVPSPVEGPAITPDAPPPPAATPDARPLEPAAGTP